MGKRGEGTGEWGNKRGKEKEGGKKGNKRS